MKPTVEMRLDAGTLGRLFKLDVRSVHLVGTLSGMPYLKIVAEAPRGFADGDRVLGTIKTYPNGTIELGVKKV